MGAIGMHRIDRGRCPRCRRRYTLVTSGKAYAGQETDDHVVPCPACGEPAMATVGVVDRRILVAIAGTRVSVGGHSPRPLFLPGSQDGLPPGLSRRALIDAHVLPGWIGTVVYGALGLGLALLAVWAIERATR